MGDNKNELITNSVECRFKDESDYRSDDIGLKKVLKENWNVDLSNNSKVSKLLLDVILMHERNQPIYGDNNNYQAMSRDARVSISIRLDESYAAIISIVSSLLNTYINESTEISSIDSIANIILTFFDFFKNSVHINKGYDICVARIIVNLYGQHDCSFFLQDIIDYIDNTLKNPSVSCPFKNICKISDEIPKCLYESTDFTIILSEIISNLEKNHVIEKINDNQYRIKRLISIS